MGAADISITMKEELTLPSVGINPQFITVSSQFLLITNSSPVSLCVDVAITGSTTTVCIFKISIAASTIPTNCKAAMIATPKISHLPLYPLYYAAVRYARHRQNHPAAIISVGFTYQP